MCDKFYPIPIEQMLKMILDELKNSHSIFGIEQSLFFNPTKDNKLRTQIFGQEIATPIGVAAGPHTQMSQNIIASWLMGCRYIELKTIQTLDELEVSKPCIDMQDEGYNCEWSQELKIEQSFSEYLNAWTIIHILNHELGFGSQVDTIFNMSVGYNLEGIMKPNVQWFFDKMGNCAAELAANVEKARAIYPDVINIDIPNQLSNNITLSTMHGCPANEIEGIAKYLLEKKHLHTLVKLNPTLLGPDELRNTLNFVQKFSTRIPDIAFEHDLKYPDAVKIITSLRQCAKQQGLDFGLKLTNTLESVNTKDIFKPDVDMMYMSGRALHPISINLANRLQDSFNGELLLSFSAGANAFNIANTLRCGFRTVTASSDLLRPGGYRRINQYISNINSAIEENGINNLKELVAKCNKQEFLSNYSINVLLDNPYQNQNLHTPLTKSPRKLSYFDCIQAPCVDTCPTNQNIPQYLHYTATGQFDKALETILRTNPFPSITGMVCSHQCQPKCTRTNFDNALQIREVKRFIAENAQIKLFRKPANGKSAAIVGAGPSGLSCAFYLAMAGFKVDVFEAHTRAGGMAQYAIPEFRLTDEAINRDFSRLQQLGVNICYSHRVTATEFQQLKSSYSYIYLSPGAQKAAEFKVEEAETNGVYNPLEFLFGVREGKITSIGNNVAVIGGGNTAMDIARTALRLTKGKGNVAIVYRRTIFEMPADQAEICAAIDEGVGFIELATPEKIITEKGKVAGLVCSRMELKGVDAKGRPCPVVIPNSQFTVTCETIIPALGQAVDIDFAPAEMLKADKNTYKTLFGNVYIGGDALHGASTVIAAIADGRKAANQIICNAGITLDNHQEQARKHTYAELMQMRSTRKFSQPEANELTDSPNTFDLVSRTLAQHEAIAEAKRCLWCNELCGICTTVCPNLANFIYKVKPTRYHLKKVNIATDNSISYENDDDFTISQEYQILNIGNFCNQCGNCSTFCPTSSAPYIEKPKLYLTTESFNQNTECYMLVKVDCNYNLIYKHDKMITTLMELGNEYIYENDFAHARINKNTFELLEVRAKTPCVRQILFRHAAEMSVVLQGAKQLLK